MAGALFAAHAAAQTAVTSAPDVTTFSLDFETLDGGPPRHGQTLTSEYLSTHGISFPEGALVQQCNDGTPTSLCATIVPETGQFAITPAPSPIGAVPAFEIEFAKPILGLSFSISPALVPNIEYVGVVVTGLDGAGEPRNEATVVYRGPEARPFWRAAPAISDDAGAIARVRIQALNLGANASPIPFVIDNLAWTCRGCAISVPLASGLVGIIEDPARAAPTFDRMPARAAPPGSEYPFAQPLRARIAWDTARAAADAVRAAGRTPAIDLDPATVERINLPVLLPAGAVAADGRISVKGDAYHALMTADGVTLAIHGTRIFYDLSRGTDDDLLSIYRTEDGLAASFSLFGAAYGIEIMCVADDDQRCIAPDFLRAQVDALAILVRPGGENP